MNKPFYLVSWITILSGLALCLYVGYLLTYPFKVSESTFKVVSSVVKPGGNLILAVDYCKWMDVPAIVTRQLNDGVIIELPPAVTNLPVGCYKNTIRYIPLPTGIPEGKYTYQTTLEYQVNILRTVRSTTTSPEFHVRN